MFGNLDQMKMLGTVAGLLKDKDKIRAAGERLKAGVSDIRAEGVSGGGACRAVATGRMRLESITLDPALAAGLADEASKPEAERLIVDAVNNAIETAQARAAEMVQAEAKELGLEGVIGDALKDFGDPAKGLDSVGKLLG
ncbi:MAG: YbaB/EbfC family nucleoid-associated protein [Planctomycetota bacterium]